MSAIIARQTGAGFIGRKYRGEPGTPSHLGKALWKLYHQHYAANLSAMLADLLDHPVIGVTPLANLDLGAFYNETALGKYQWCYQFDATASGSAYLEILFRLPGGNWQSVGYRFLEREEPNWYVFEARASSSLSLSALTSAKAPAPAYEDAAENLARAIEARAQVRGTNASVWFVFPGGMQELLHQNENGDGWVSTGVVPGWGVTDISIPVRSRLEGIRNAVARGASELKDELAK